MRSKTSRFLLEVLNPHKDQLLIFYILHKDQLLIFYILHKVQLLIFYILHKFLIQVVTYFLDGIFSCCYSSFSASSLVFSCCSCHPAALSLVWCFVVCIYQPTSDSLLKLQQIYFWAGIPVSYGTPLHLLNIKGRPLEKWGEGKVVVNFRLAGIFFCLHLVY